jgi:heat shock protein HslJ
MKGTIAFMFFMLFLAGIAFVNLRGMSGQSGEIPASPKLLTNSSWTVERLGEMRLSEDSEMQITFKPDGEVAGYAGCNRFSGSYEFVNDELKIGTLAATRMACPEPAMSFEVAFLDALHATSGASAVGRRLLLKNDKGDTTVTLNTIGSAAAK